ncbi:aminopeptidase, partial [bacterium]
NHAMVFIGVDTLGGKPLKWLVENSWGTDRGNKGYWTMYDNWFDEYVFAVIINKAYLPDDVTALFKTKPITLPAWDPMRDMYR